MNHQSYPWEGLYSEEEIKAYLVLGDWVRCDDCNDALPYDEAALHPGMTLCPRCDDKRSVEP